MYELFAVPAFSLAVILAISLRELLQFTSAKPMLEQIEDAQRDRRMTMHIEDFDGSKHRTRRTMAQVEHIYQGCCLLALIAVFVWAMTL